MREGADLFWFWERTGERSIVLLCSIDKKTLDNKEKI
jgi:hypothetical protein